MATDKELHRRDEKPGKSGVQVRQSAAGKHELSRSDINRINREVNRELWEGPYSERAATQHGRDQERSSGRDS